jgi:O-antigen/teichoic acid export membrane protein
MIGKRLRYAYPAWAADATVSRAVTDDEHTPTSEHTPSRATDRAELSRSELSVRASRGVMIVMAWGLTSLALGFVGNVILARLLEPADFGIFAIGSVVLLVTYGLSEAGLGPGMIRRPEAPTREELRALTGFQVAATSALAFLVAAVALPFGTTGAVVAVMVTAMPISDLQTHARILFARTLAYERLAAAEAAIVLSFYAWSITTVSLGAGVWGLATGAVVRAVFGTVTIWLVSDVGVVLPGAIRWKTTRPLVSYGLRIQATWLVIMIRDLVLNATAAALVGIASLGLWSLARRLMEVPLVLFDSLWRVTFPAMSHILTGGEDPAPLLERGGRVFTVIASLALVVFVGTFPGIIPMLFGEEWRGVGNIIPWAAVGLLIAGTVSVATVAYLQAAGHPEDTLVAAVVFALVWIATTASLLPVVGIEAVGMGWITGGIAEALLLDQATRRRSGARVLRASIVPLLAGVAGCAAAGIASLTVPSGPEAAVAGVSTGILTTVAGLVLFARPVLRETVETSRTALKRALSRPLTPASSD